MEDRLLTWLPSTPAKLPQLTVAMPRYRLVTGGLVAKDSRRKSVHFLYLLGLAGAGYVVRNLYLSPFWGTVAVVTGWIFVVVVWVLVLMPTYCDYDVGARGCTREVYGKFRGCWQHRRLKRDAVWAAFGRRNPGMAVRLTWGDDRPQSGRRVGTNTGMSDMAAQQGVYNASMWIFAAVSAVAAVIALFLSK